MKETLERVTVLDAGSGRVEPTVALMAVLRSCANGKASGSGTLGPGLTVKIARRMNRWPE